MDSRMREHRESLLKLPYSMGCATSSCVEVGRQKRRANNKHVLFPPPPLTPGETGEKEGRLKAKIGNIRSYLVLRYYAGFNRVIKSFKSFPKLFVYEEEEEEESDVEIEIGLPTDVKHVTHIGWDGATTINPAKGWENLQATQEILSLSSSISLRQFELAMSTQAARDQSVCDQSVCVSGINKAATSLAKENKLENV